MGDGLPLAHELWFTDDVPARDWSFAFEPLTVAYLCAVVLLTLAVRAISTRIAGIDIPQLARLWPWMPFAVRIHLGVSLIGLVSAGSYLAPSMPLDGISGWFLGGLMVATAALLIAGWHARVAALLLVAAGPIGMLVYGVSPILQRLDVLGLALFILAAGPGRWSADGELERGLLDVPRQRLGQALWALRVCAGVSFVVVAFVEKLANPALAVEFLNSQSTELNVARAVGLPVTDLEFVRIAGAIEVLFGLLVLSGALPQAVVLIVGIPFNLTLYFFGTIEMLGHLPIYAAMLVLLVYGSSPELRPPGARGCGRGGGRRERHAAGYGLASRATPPDTPSETALGVR